MSPNLQVVQNLSQKVKKMIMSIAELFLRGQERCLNRPASTFSLLLTKTHQRLLILSPWPTQMTRLNTRGKIGKIREIVWFSAKHTFRRIHFVCITNHHFVFSGRWHRKGLRRRPPTPPTSATSEISGPSDLKQRILEILTTTNNNQNCDPELIRLRRELESNANEAMASRRPHHSR